MHKNMKDIEMRKFLSAETPTISNRELSIDEASDMLGVSPQTLRNWEASGRLKVKRTSGGHRRYSEDQINEVKKAQMGDSQILIPGVTISNILKMTESFFLGLDPEKKVNITINTNWLDRKVIFTVDSDHGLETRSKVFKMEVFK